jgi:hypothetical protein
VGAKPNGFPLRPHSLGTFAFEGSRGSLGRFERPNEIHRNAFSSQLQFGQAVTGFAISAVAQGCERGHGLGDTPDLRPLGDQRGTRQILAQQACLLEQLLHSSFVCTRLSGRTTMEHRQGEAGLRVAQIAASLEGFSPVVQRLDRPAPVGCVFPNQRARGSITIATSRHVQLDRSRVKPLGKRLVRPHLATFGIGFCEREARVRVPLPAPALLPAGSDAIAVDIGCSSYTAKQCDGSDEDAPTSLACLARLVAHGASSSSPMASRRKHNKSQRDPQPSPPAD